MKKINIKSKRFKSTVETQAFRRKVRASKHWAELRTNKKITIGELALYDRKTKQNAFRYDE